MAGAHAAATPARVHLDGRDITGLAPHRVAAAGMARTFQLMRPFDSMTVLENVAVAAHGRRRPPRAARTGVAAEVIERVGLDQWRDVAERAACRPPASSGSSWPARWPGEPRVLLLDEVLAGLVPPSGRP